MSNINTIVVEALDSAMADQAGATATSVANAASTNRIAIQTNGTFQLGTYSATGASDLIKLSAATTMSDGSTSVTSSSEFLKGEITSSHYSAASAGAAATYTLEYAAATKVGGQYFVRLERRDGQGIGATETFSEETLAKLATKFAARKTGGMTEFDNVTITATDADTLSIAVAAKDADSDVNISANDGVTYTNVNPTNKKGSLTIAKGLEKSGHINMGAYNQYAFPIVVPETSTAAAEDYGIYTIELKKTVGKRTVYETIKVLIAGDESSVNKTVTAIQNICGLSSADLTVPTVLTSTQFVLANGSDAATAYSTGGSTPMHIKIVGGEIGAVVKFTIGSGGSEADVVESFTIAATTETFALAIAADNYAAGVTITANAVQTDSNNNVSGAVTTADTAVIQS